VALVLCQRVEREATTGNPTLVGIFSAIELDSFPKATDPFAIWVQMTNGNGVFHMQLRITYVRSEHFEDDHDREWKDGRVAVSCGVGQILARRWRTHGRATAVGQRLEGLQRVDRVGLHVQTDPTGDAERRPDVLALVR
jgi:hypothetical protein